MSTETTADAVLYCGFRLGQRRFGVPVSLVAEVHAPMAIAPIPRSPRDLRGYVNLRGNLYLVLDPRELLTGESAHAAQGGHLIVFKNAAGENFAIQTDGVEDILQIRDDQIDEPKADAMRTAGENDRWQRPITGHAKLDEGMMTLVEPRELLDVVFSER